MAMAFIACLVGPAVASAVPPTYVFNPVLSLAGDCSTSAFDSVPDPAEPACPSPEGAHPPSGTFSAPGVAVDSFGDIYVASHPESENGRIDVFSPKGFFITEIPDSAGPQSIGVDSEGNVYTFDRLPGHERMVRRFPPTAYKPEEEEIEYGKPIVLADESSKNVLSLGPFGAVAVDSKTSRVFLDNFDNIALFGSAKEGNGLLDKEVLEVPEGKTQALAQSAGFAVDGNHRRLYVSDKLPSSSYIRIFNLDSPYEELGTIDGSTTPKGEFLQGEGFLRLTVNSVTGEVFVWDAPANRVYQFKEDGSYVASIEHNLHGGPLGGIAVDDGASSPNPGYLFVPSIVGEAGHVYAFEAKVQGPPIVESAFVAEVTEDEATLHATINPDGLPTEYRLQYISQQQFEEEGESFANATIAGEGTLAGGGEGVDVSATATGLESGTPYRFRVFAENKEGKDEKTTAFVTFEETAPLPHCENETLRTGPSALLPDCRAYELVTPPSTNGLSPVGVGFTGVYFPTREASPDGERVSYLIEGGTIPSGEGAGAFNGDPYLATRGSAGWSNQSAGPSGKEAIGPNPGSVSPDQTYSFWEDFQIPTVYLHYPDGHSELVGQGSLGTQADVGARLITEDGGHVIFTATAPLEPNAPPAGTAAVYDRSAEGPTHVVSLLPGGEPPKAGESASYLGSSEEGEGVAFAIKGTIYLRLHNAETFEVAGPGSTFAGAADEGNRVFYLEGGNLFAFDAEAEETIPFSSSGDVTPVNVATDGTRAYFISPSKLTSEPNPHGEEAKVGEENLYLSEEGTISFVGIVTKRDVEGEHRSDGQVGGLGLWISGIGFSSPSVDPSRTTPSGTTLLFESRADLTGFESKGFAQIYRYDSAQNRLACLSCNPPGTPPTSDASLQSLAQSQPSLLPASSHAVIPSQSPDGKRAFFQTAEPLVLGDTDGKLDVYEWEEEGVGSCKKAGGCVYLISGAHSSSPDFLFAMSASGNDVYFRTADILLPRDAESTLSIYDARVEGGFPEAEPEAVCEGEGCRQLGSGPSFPEPKTTEGGPTEPGKPACPKGKHAVKRHGKVLCVKKHHNKHHRKASSARKVGSK
jgi:hypothetical protein